MYKNLKEMNC